MPWRTVIDWHCKNVKILLSLLGLLRPFVFYIRLTLAEKDRLTRGP